MLADETKLIRQAQTLHLARLEAYCEEQKWCWVVSKFYERTGKRFDPTALKAKWESKR